MLVPVCLSIVEKRKTGEHLAAKVVSTIIAASERADRLDIWWGPTLCVLMTAKSS